MQDSNFEKVLDAETISRRVQELGRLIGEDYAGHSLVVVGVLNGAFLFMADLIRAMELPLEVDFIRVASYGNDTVSSGNCRMTKDVELCLAGRHVLVVEDIVDTGRTVEFLKEKLMAAGAATVRFCVLLDKEERREKEISVEYVGFSGQHGFLVGYGLDCAGRYRNLPGVFRIVTAEK